MRIPISLIILRPGFNGGRQIPWKYYYRHNCRNGLWDLGFGFGFARKKKLISLLNKPQPQSKQWSGARPANRWPSDVSTLNEPEMGEGPGGEPPKRASLIMSSYSWPAGLLFLTGTRLGCLFPFAALNFNPKDTHTHRDR